MVKKTNVELDEFDLHILLNLIKMSNVATVPFIFHLSFGEGPKDGLGQVSRTFGKIVKAYIDTHPDLQYEEVTHGLLPRNPFE